MTKHALCPYIAKTVMYGKMKKCHSLPFTITILDLYQCEKKKKNQGIINVSFTTESLHKPSPIIFHFTTNVQVNAHPTTTKEIMQEC